MTTDIRDFWCEVAEDCAQLESVLGLVNDQPELLGDYQAAAGLAVLELATALHRARLVAVDMLRAHRKAT